MTSTALATRLATCFGIGWISFAPGTWASAAALPFGWLLVRSGWPAIVVGALAVSALGVWACGAYARERNIYDPSECVLDEVAGQWIALIPIAFALRGGDWLLYGIAFLLFRLFDIWKPWPVSAVERLPGGFGVMMDDIVAGAIGATILFGILAMRLV